GVAPVRLDVIDAPPGILRRVLELMALAARTAGAGLVAGIGVDAEPETAPVKIIAERLHSRRKARRIGLNIAVSVARALPAIVDVDVNVSRIAQAGRNHRVGGLLDQRLIDLAAVAVPAV